MQRRYTMPAMSSFIVVDRIGAATSTCTRLSALRRRRVALYALATYPGRDSNPHGAVCKTAARPSCCPGSSCRVSPGIPHQWVGQDLNLRGADRAPGLQPATISLSVTHPYHVVSSCFNFGTVGVEPTFFAVSERRSTAELGPNIRASARNRTWNHRRKKPLLYLIEPRRRV